MALFRAAIINDHLSVAPPGDQGGLGRALVALEADPQTYGSAKPAVLLDRDDLERLRDVIDEALA